MNKYTERLYNGIWKENPIFVQMLGLCPTLAVTTSAMNGLGMGLSSTVVLVAANFIISLMRSIIPGRVRLPGEIVVVASLVTIVDMLMEGFTPDLYSALGIYIPLIVVNCVILGRAEAFAMKNKPIISAFDGAGMGLGFTFALVCIGAVRELLGAGSIFGVAIMPASYQPISVFTSYSSVFDSAQFAQSPQQAVLAFLPLAEPLVAEGIFNLFCKAVKQARTKNAQTVQNQRRKNRR